MRWELRGTPNQNAIIQNTLGRCDFPFGERLQIAVIPVEWADLSRYNAAVAVEATEAPRQHGDLVEEDGETAIKVYDKARKRVLGLAWYSGKITIDTSLESNPDLAGEVWISEGAHMVDFFYMEDDHRVAVWNAVHPPEQHLPLGTNIEDGVDLGHGHGWFDVGTYREWVGEEFMGLFVRAFSDLPVTIVLSHTWDADAITQVRMALLGTPSQPPAEPDLLYFASNRGATYHDSHKGIPAERVFTRLEDAQTAGLRACKTCKPA